MDKQNTKDHKILALEDRLALVGELEHERRHLLRAAHLAEDDGFFYLVKAGEATDLRRRLMEAMPITANYDWCIVKSATAIKQLNYETMVGEEDIFKEIETFVDSLTTHALGVDLTDCASCTADRLESQELTAGSDEV